MKGRLIVVLGLAAVLLSGCKDQPVLRNPKPDQASAVVTNTRTRNTNEGKMHDIQVRNASGITEWLPLGTKPFGKCVIGAKYPACRK